MTNEQIEAPRVVLVTGGSAGIGRAAASEIARAGSAVVLTYRSRPGEAEQTVDAIRAFGGQAQAMRLDLADTASFAAFASSLGALISRTWGASSLSALVNNGGHGGGKTFEEMTEDDFDHYYRVLLKGPYFLTKALLPLMSEGASIVNVSSSSVRPGETQPGYSGYAGMKAGLVVASQYLARELGPRGIRVNTIAPGATRTRIGDDAFERHPEIVDAMAAQSVFGRIGEPEDIGRVIAFMVSDGSAWITGQDVLVAGGSAL